jgi:hypothetical protein
MGDGRGKITERISGKMKEEKRNSEDRRWKMEDRRFKRENMGGSA